MQVNQIKKKLLIRFYILSCFQREEVTKILTYKHLNTHTYTQSTCHSNCHINEQPSTSERHQVKMAQLSHVQSMLTHHYQRHMTSK